VVLIHIMMKLSETSQSAAEVRWYRP